MTIGRFDDGGVDAEVVTFDQRPEEPPNRWRELVILAQDPTVKLGDRAIRAKVRVPREDLMPGPRGHRFQVVDFDATNPARLENPVIDDDDLAQKAWLALDDGDLIESPVFRAQNVYAIAARTLDTFEQALGRRVPWSHAGHQLFLVPRAFREANAFYDPDAHAVFFGYFDLPDGSCAYTSLSHDIVAHETTHAVLDGLRSRFQEPGLPDQAAFHEAFADIVALLSVFSMPEVVGAVAPGDTMDRLVAADRLTAEALAATALLGLGEQLGVALGSYGAAQRGSALRTSVGLTPGIGWIDDPDWEEPHLRGEILVAAVIKAFVAMWVRRLGKILGEGKRLDVDIAVEEGAKAADHLLRMAIRAIDYSPPLEFLFADFLDAILVSDAEVAPDDEHDYRGALRSSFGVFGDPAAARPDHGRRDRRDGACGTRPCTRTSSAPAPTRSTASSGTTWASWTSRPTSTSRWTASGRAPGWGRTASWSGGRCDVRPGARGNRGRADAPRSREDVLPDARRRRGIHAGEDLRGRGLIFDQWGRPKYHQSKPLFDWDRQKARLEYLDRSGIVDRQGRLGFGTPLPAGLALRRAPRARHEPRGDLVMAPEPTTVTVRMHQVAFGDCFLLSVGYTDGRNGTC